MRAEEERRQHAAAAAAVTATDSAAGESRFILGDLLDAGQRTAFLAAAAAAADPALTTPGDALRALHSYTRGTCGILLGVCSAAPPADDPFCTEALRAVLRLSTRIAREAPDELIAVMPKRCPGCVALNLALPVAIDASLEPDAAAAMRELMGDAHGRIVEAGELCALAPTLRASYKRRDDAFPFMGNCLDFGLPDGRALPQRLGALLVSKRLRRWMARDESAALAAVARYLRSPHESWPEGGEL